MARMILTGDRDDFEVNPTNGKSFTLNEMQRLVADGGLIEMLTLAPDVVLVFDEEGKLNGRAYNVAATDLVKKHSTIDSFGEPGSWSKDLKCERDYIVGDCLVCTEAELEGEE